MRKFKENNVFSINDESVELTKRTHLIHLHFNTSSFSWDIQFRMNYKHVDKVDLEFMVCVRHLNLYDQETFTIL